MKPPVQFCTDHRQALAHKMKAWERQTRYYVNRMNCWEEFDE
jgi:hypothetical protein